MSSDGENNIYYSVNQPSRNLDTDGTVSDILVMEKENTQPNLYIKCDFSDISDAELVKVSQVMEETKTRFAAPLNKEDIDDLVKNGLSKKNWNRNQMGTFVV